MSEVRENSDPAPTEEQEEPKPAGENKEERTEEWKDLMGQDLQMKVRFSQATSYGGIIVCSKRP
jgi:hypothetical protein